MKSIRSVFASLSVLSLVGMLAVRAAADPTPIYGLAGLAYQPALPSTSGAAILAFASTSGASHIETVSLVPIDALACDGTDYAGVDLYDVDAAGIGSAVYSTDTTCGGTGDWTAGVVAISVPLAYDLPAGHTLAAIWRQEGLGVSVPSGAWRIE